MTSDSFDAKETVADQLVNAAYFVLLEFVEDQETKALAAVKEIEGAEEKGIPRSASDDDIASKASDVLVFTPALAADLKRQFPLLLEAVKAFKKAAETADG